MEVMASDIASVGVQEAEHSHQSIATHESLKSSEDQNLIKTQAVDCTIMDKAGTQRGIQRSLSSETVNPQITSNDDLNPTQKLLAFQSDQLVSPSDQIVSKTEVKEVSITDEADAQERMKRRPSSGSEDVPNVSEDELNRNLLSKPRKANKRTSKRSKIKESRIAELTSQADLDGDSPIDARAKSQGCRKALQDPETKLQESTVQSKPSPRELRIRKNQFSHAQDDYQEVQQIQQKLASIQRKYEASQNDLRHMQNTRKQLQKARKKLAALQDDLTACRDELFRLQPIAQSTDSRVEKELESLCQRIVNWIEAEVVLFEKAPHPETGPEHIFSAGEDKEAAQFMNQHPRSGEHLATHMIHWWLQDHVFGQKVSYLGLPAEATQLLERAEQSMARLDPPRDSTTIAAWRSETLKALAGTEEYKNTRIRETQDMNDLLFKDLSKALPILFSGPQRHCSFHTQILEPAVTLACTMQESTTKYVWSLQKGVFAKRRPFSKDVLKNNKVVDMKTGKCLKPNSLVTADQQGFIGTVVLMVEPGLCRLKGDRQGHTLKQGTFIVNLEFPLQERNRA